MKYLFSTILFYTIFATNALGQQKISLKFYGTPIEVSSFPSRVEPLTSLENEAIAATIESVSSSDIEKLLSECTQLKGKLALNDWGYLKLVDKVAHACLSNDNEAVVLFFLLMSFSEYDVKLGKSDNNLFLSFATKHTIYGYSYYNINNSTYYIYPLSNNKKATILNLPNTGKKPISFILEQVPNLAQNTSAPKELKAKRYPEWFFNVSCNENLIDFYNDIPTSAFDNNFMTRWSQLANTPLSKEVQRQLYPKMSQLTKGLSQYEAVERILNWIQTALKYEYDEDVWGYDRAFFPEETLYYPYSDTEDRSALMSRIITDLLKLKTVIIYYPGHTAVGVAFTDEDVKGDSVMHEGQKYTVCDGIYINAHVGKSIPNIGEPQRMISVAPVNHLLAFLNTPERNANKRQEGSPKPQPSPQPKQTSTATIDWIDFTPIVNKKEYELKIGIKSASKIEEVNITVNDSKSRGINTVKSDGYDMKIAKTLFLSEGYNQIVVEVRNANGITTSEKMVNCKIANQTPVVNQKRIALVMGNANYQDADKRLKNPVNDATDIATKLKALGFTVISSFDQTKRGMETAIYEFGRKAQNYDVALFYYAGHGIGCNGSNFLVPTDADLPEEVAVQYNCTNANLVLDVMDQAKCQMKIVILDACRNNPFARSWNRSITGKGLNIMNAPKGTFIAFSTAPGDVALDGNERNSPYTTALLQTLDVPNLSLTDFFQEVLEKVATQTGERQNPWTSNSFRGKFYFNQNNR